MPPDATLAKKYSEIATFEIWATAESGWMWYRLFVNSPDAPPKPNQLFGSSGRVIYWSLLTSFIFGVTRMISTGKRELTYGKILNLIPTTPSKEYIEFQANRNEYLKRTPSPRRFNDITKDEIESITKLWEHRIARTRTRLLTLQRNSSMIREYRDKLLAHLDVSHAIDESRIPSINTERIRRLNISFSRVGNEIVSIAAGTSIDTEPRTGFQHADDLIRRCQSHADLLNLQTWAMHNGDDAEIAKVVHWYRACGIPPEADNRYQASPRIAREMPSHYKLD